jgi:Ran GTPase-activating protein (RanGAP) involved in mRNA processing and transport
MVACSCLSLPAVSLKYAKLAALSLQNSVTELDLSMTQQTDDHAQLLGEMLSKKSTSIKKLCLKSVCLTEHGLQLLANGLDKNSVLQNLDLSWNNFGAAGSCTLWKTIAQNNSQAPLHTLSLSSTGITHQDASVLAEALRKNTMLRILNLSMNKLGADGAREISRVLYPYSSSHTANGKDKDKDTTSVELSIVSHTSTTSHAPQGDQAAAADQKTEEDTKGDVSAPRDNTARNKQQYAIHAHAHAPASQNHDLNNDCALRELDLSHNGISGAGATAIACALRHNTSLQKLDISSNNVQADGCMEICSACMPACLGNSQAQAFQTLTHACGALNMNAHAHAPSVSSHSDYNTTLTYRDYNTTLTHTHCDMNAQAHGAPSVSSHSDYYNTTLTYLNMSTNSLEASGAHHTAQMLSRNHTLRTLDLTHNHLTEAGLTAVASSLTCNTTLLHLILWSNNLTTPSARAFAAALQKNRTLRTLDFTSFSLSQDDVVTPFGAVLRDYPRYHHFSLLGVSLWKVADVLGSRARETDWTNNVILHDVERIHADMLLAFVMGTHARLGSESVVKIWSECADVCCVVGALFYGLPVSFFSL